MPFGIRAKRLTGQCAARPTRERRDERAGHRRHLSALSKQEATTYSRQETHQAIEATFRIERARLIARLARMVRNVRAESANPENRILCLDRGSDLTCLAIFGPPEA
jgi:hypothetical protein